MNFWDWIFGRGKDEDRKGPAHSSDRHGFWKDLWKLRKFLDLDIDHSGSVDIYDHFGCAPWNDNETKRERRKQWRPVLRTLASHQSPDVHIHALQLLVAFDEADGKLEV